MSGERCLAPALARPGEGERRVARLVEGVGGGMLKKKKSFYGAQMNARCFLFTFDLPLSPTKMTERMGGRGVEKGGER